MTNFTKNKGFTLIELLVVVAIIGILASVVLASLGGARNKGGDAGVKSNLASAKNQAEVQHLLFGCYANSGSCTTTLPTAFPAANCPAASVGTPIFRNSIIASQIVAAKSAGGGLTSCSSSSGGTAWAIAVQLKSDDAKAWCVDSVGASKEVSNASAYTQTTLNGEIAGSVCGS